MRAFEVVAVALRVAKVMMLVRDFWMCVLQIKSELGQMKQLMNQRLYFVVMV